MRQGVGDLAVGSAYPSFIVIQYHRLLDVVLRSWSACGLGNHSSNMASTTASASSEELPSGQSSISSSTGGPLFLEYKVNSVVELTLAPNSETIRGLVYCTDHVSNSIVLKKSLKHTTLASEIHIINAASVTSKKVILQEAPLTAKQGETAEELALPLPNVSKKALEEREKRAIRLAEESFRHINEKVRMNAVISLCLWEIYIILTIIILSIGFSGRTGSL